MASVESSLTLTSQGALIAPLWTPNHTTANGNYYKVGTLVNYEVDGVLLVYKCIADNDSIVPTSTLYWVNLGPGYLIQQEKPDWNAIDGDSQILNKPDLTGYITDAPDDGSQYVRKNESWNKLTNYSEDDPTSASTPLNGFPLGSDWYNTVTGEKFYQKANGVWISYTASTPPIDGGDSPVVFANLATTVQLPNSPVYDNGIGGLGATLTASSNGALTVDGPVGSTVVGDTILIKDQPAFDPDVELDFRYQNGVYILSQQGSSTLPYILTRVDYADESAELYPSQVNILDGVTNRSRYFLQKTEDPTLGSDPIDYQINYVPPTQVITLPLIHVDTATTEPLPDCTYVDEFAPFVPGSPYLSIPIMSYLTATTNGPLGTINGVNMSILFGAARNRKILIKNQVDPIQNGDYEVVQIGSVSQPWKLRRITTNYNSFDKNTREWKINNEASTLYGNRYYMNYTSGFLGIIGNDPITFSELEAGGGSQDLQSVTDVGNTTDNDIQFGTGAGVYMNNGSRLKEGSIDAGYGGSKGIAQICAVGYELKWEAGRLYVMGDGGTTVREVSHNFTTVPTNYNDVSEGFIVGSRWLLDDGTLYVCTDNSNYGAVWELQVIGTQDLQSVTDNGATTTNTITVGDVAGNFSQVLNSAVGTQDAAAGTYAYLDSSGQLGLHNGTVESDLRNDNVSNPGVILQYPNLPTGSYTIATTDDIASIPVPTLQQVTYAGNTTTDVISSALGFETLLSGSFDPMAFIGITSINNSGIITYKGVMSLQEGSLDGTGSVAYLTTTTLSQNRFLSLPNKDGILAVTNDIVPQVNSNWNATSGVAQILNKPTIDSTPTNGSNNAVSSDGVFDALALKADLVAGKVPTSQLPSYVDDVIEGYYSAPTFYSNAGLTTPIVPETGKIYVDLLQNKSYRWSGSVYIQISNAISSIDELTDVTIASPLNGQLLQYNLTTSQWENKTVTVGNGDMQKSTYDIDNDGIVDFAETVPVVVRNNSVTDILRKGTIVYLNGSTGFRPNAFKAQANAEATSSGTFGVVLEDIATNTDGTVAMLGTIHTLDTRNAATGAPYPFTNDILLDGDVLWLSPTTAGYVTKTKPQAPNHAVFIGVVARSHPSLGRIVYRITNGYELDELHNVFINGTLADKHTLYYDAATSLWKTNTIEGILGFNPAQLLTAVTVDANIGSRLRPADAASNGFYFNKSFNGSVGYTALNTNTGNSAVVNLGVGIDSNSYIKNIFVAKFGPNYFVPLLAGKGGLLGTEEVFVGSTDNNDVSILTGVDFSSVSRKFTVKANGQLLIQTTPATGTTSDFVLVRDSSGNVKQIAYPTGAGASTPLRRQEFTYSGSQNFTLLANPSYTYGVFVNGQELNSTQYSITTNVLTILNTLQVVGGVPDSVNIVYGETAPGILDYYTKAQVDILIANATPDINIANATKITLMYNT